MKNGIHIVIQIFYFFTVINVFTQLKKPNVVFIMCDDLNDYQGIFGGHPQAKTPNIDRLAKSGVLFTNAHCQAPICNPSRVSLLTGVRPSTSGVYALNQPLRKAPALKSATTIPAQFKASGYYVLGRGKIYHGKPYLELDYFWPWISCFKSKNLSECMHNAQV